jgi:hypothetical protein
MGRPAHLAFTGLNAERSAQYDERPPVVPERWSLVSHGAPGRPPCPRRDGRKEPLSDETAHRRADRVEQTGDRPLESDEDE